MQKSSSESREKLLLKLIGQFSNDVIGCKNRVHFININWSVSNCLLLVKLSCSVCGLFFSFVYVVNKSFVTCQ